MATRDHLDPVKAKKCRYLTIKRRVDIWAWNNISTKYSTEIAHILAPIVFAAPLIVRCGVLSATVVVLWCIVGGEQ